MDHAVRALQDLVAEFENLPGIGHKTAERLAYHVLSVDREEALRLSEAVRRVKEELRSCARCFHIAEAELCPICADEARDRRTICVVEQSNDLFAIERSGSYDGVYHVLQGVFAPLDGVAPKDLTIDSLIERIRRDGADEVILATNPNFEGEGTALFLSEQLAKAVPEIQVTRIARGVPSGSSLEHVAKNIVSDALEGRRRFGSGEA